MPKSLNTLKMNKITTTWRSLPGATLLLFALFWSACQKAELPPNVTEPTVFSVTESLNQVALTAGLNQIYLYTDVTRNAGEVLVFSGTFTEVGCQPVEACPGSVRFEFRNVNLGSDVSPEEAFREGEYEYADLSSGAMDTVYRTRFVATDTAAFQGFEWEFNTTDSASGKVVVRDFPDLNPVSVELISRVPKAQVQSARVRRKISLESPELFPSVKIGLMPDSVSGENKIQAITTGPPVVNYSWLPDSTENKAQYFRPEFENQYAITVTDGNDNTASAQAIGTEGLQTVFVTPNFVYSMQPIVTGDLLQLGRVTIQWVDEQGVVWRSDRAKQVQDAWFIVTSTAPYDPNEKGQKTRKMDVLFRCLLYSPGLEIREFEGTGVIAVAY